MEIGSYITGFTDGEGCFSISFSLRKKMKYGIEVRPSFSVSQHQRNKEIVQFFQEYFSCGSVRFSKNDDNYKYEVRSVRDHIKYIIPHFQMYPLKTSKQEDFQRFTEICSMIRQGHHRQRNGLITIIHLAAAMNAAGKRRYTPEYLLQIVSKMNV